jgi:hypothetical protein
MRPAGVTRQLVKIAEETKETKERVREKANMLSYV